MPRTVLDQEGKFKQDEIFKRLSEVNKIRYTGHKSGENGRSNFLQDLQLGKLDIAFIDSGINLRLNFDTPGPNTNGSSNNENVRFDNEDRVHLQSHLILNGVCVKCLCYINLKDLTGTARVEFDRQMAQEESMVYKNQLRDYHFHFGPQEENIPIESVLEGNTPDAGHLNDNF